MRAKSVLLAGVVAISAVCAANAQMATVRLTAEDMHTIKEIVLKEMKAPKVARGDYKIGEPAPSGAELQEFPSLVADKVSAIKSHRFFVSGEMIFIVDPKNNTIAEIIE